MFKKVNLSLIVAMIISLSLTTYSCLEVEQDVEQNTEILSSDAKAQLRSIEQENVAPCQYIPATAPSCREYPGTKLTVNIPSKGNRPACIVKVKFDANMCNINGNRTIQIFNLSIQELCPEVVSYFNSLSQADKDRELAKFEYEVSLVAEADYAAYWYSEEPDENVITHSTFNTVLCYTNCIESYDIKTNPGESPKTVFKVTKYSCGGDACCQRTRILTMVNGVIVATKPKFASFGSSCVKLTTKNCKEGGTAQSCNVECGPK
jgi:hypothetical protein